LREQTESCQGIGRPPATEMKRSGIEVPRGRSGGRRRYYVKAVSRRESE